MATGKTHVARILARFGHNDRVQIVLPVHDTGLLHEDEDDARGGGLG